MIDIPCLDELKNWRDKLIEYQKERTDLDQMKSKKWETQAHVSMACDHQTIHVPPSELPKSFLDLADPPFNIPIPAVDMQDRINLECLSAQIDIRDLQEQINDSYDMLILLEDVIDEAFGAVQDCVRHLFEFGGAADD